MTDRDRRHRPDGRPDDSAEGHDATDGEVGTAYPASPPPSGVHPAPAEHSDAPEREGRPASGSSPWTDYATSPYPVNPEADAPDHTLADPAYRPPDYAREPTPAHGVGAHYPPSPAPGTSWYSSRAEPAAPEPASDAEVEGAREADEPSRRESDGGTGAS
ncbi:hypothetical protein [Occultella gossypii]|uniref:Class E sortase n=1 Tax=Occultella gossypii TaxID=2800820 RepID=A0ABS7S5K9_9MICO|nr:hypothetical protein [Occultella gossypii]MBZ2195055.1 hypothetical protein [Occultella gossypii]